MNVPRWFLGLWLAGLSSASVGAAPACAPVIDQGWVRAAPPGAATLAGYLVLKNPCDAAVSVVDVESLDFAMPMIHRTEEVDGVSRMRAAGRLEVPARGELRFAPGGLHLMLMKPPKPLPEGSRVRLRLVLADGRRVYSELPVRRQAP
ncbi:copper chaperone PCu(A)C [Arenimonas sp. MALMAid1274]|uniref:copper chaperone PCu(A)C n=1 Tax=Arenimonas sp. MALMAid1274 TaxID=3411630 RepID=UPI003B9FB9A0